MIYGSFGIWSDERLMVDISNLEKSVSTKPLIYKTKRT